MDAGYSLKMVESKQKIDEPGLITLFKFSLESVDLIKNKISAPQYTKQTLS